MEMHDQQLETQWTQIQAQLAKRDWRIYPGPIAAAEAIARWPTDRPVSDFLDLAEACHCTIIYAIARPFTEDDALELLLLLDLTDESIYDLEAPSDWLEATGLLATDEGQEYLRLTQEHIGDLFRISVQWPFSGVIHSYVMTAKWHEEMEISAGRLAEMAELHE